MSLPKGKILEWYETGLSLKQLKLKQVSQKDEALPVGNCRINK